MTDVQLYLSVGVPSLVALVGILVNIGYFVALNARIAAVETTLSARMLAVEAKLATVAEQTAVHKVLLRDHIPS